MKQITISINLKRNIVKLPSLLVHRRGAELQLVMLTEMEFSMFQKNIIR
jgi:hypothetical protein